MHVCHLALVYYMWCMITMSLILALMYENLHVKYCDRNIKLTKCHGLVVSLLTLNQEVQGSNPHLPSLSIYMCIHIYIFINLASGCRFPVSKGHRMSVRCRMPVTTGCRVPVRRLHHRSCFGWAKPLQVARPPPLLVQVTLIPYIW